MTQPDVDTSAKALLSSAEIITDSRRYLDSIMANALVALDGPMAKCFHVQFKDSKHPELTGELRFTNDLDRFDLWEPRLGDSIPWELHGQAQQQNGNMDIPSARVVGLNGTHDQMGVPEMRKARQEASDLNGALGNLTKAEIDQICFLPEALGRQNLIIERLISEMGQTNQDALDMSQGISANWEGGGAEGYRDSLSAFSRASVQLANVSADMKSANITVAQRTIDIVVAVLEVWKARVEAIGKSVSDLFKGGKDAVGLIAKPTVIGVIGMLLDKVIDVLTTMATKDVGDRIDKLKELKVYAQDFAVIEKPKELAGTLAWPTPSSGAPWTPR